MSGEDRETKIEKDWKFSQWFRKLPGEDENPALSRAYELTALEFDKSGEFLASGDRSGTVVVLKNDAKKAKQKGEKTHYGLFCEITSHQQEFDYLVSKPIEPAISSLKWAPQTNGSQFLLTTNAKQIRLWRLVERDTFKYINLNEVKGKESPETVHRNPNGKSFTMPALSLEGKTKKPEEEDDDAQEGFELKIPKVVKGGKDVVCDLKRDYFRGSHKMPITQLSVSSDQENFLSCDALSINRWNLFKHDACQEIVNLLQPGVETVNEVILTLDHHPNHNNLFLYGTSRGKLNLCDNRTRSLATSPSRIFNSLKTPAPVIQTADLEEQFAQDESSMFDEVTCGVTGLQFSSGGRCVITRDYMSIKLWDINYEKKPFETIYVHEFLRARLFELHEHNRTWQDSFKVSCSSKGDIATGTYSNYFHIFDLKRRKDIFVQAAMQPEMSANIERMTRRKKVSYTHNVEEEEMKVSQKKKNGWFGNVFKGRNKNKAADNEMANSREYPYHLPFPQIDFNKKAAQIAWHPHEDVIAVAGENNLYMYSKKSIAP